MNPRVRPILVAMAVSGVLALSGCGLLTPAEDSASEGRTAGSPVLATPSPQPTLSPSETGAAGTSVKDAGDIPDVCALLSDAEIESLTGRSITQIDKDGGQPGDISRYCQWQLSAGQLAVFLSRTTAEEFARKNTDADPVPGVGQDAYLLAGHLMVLYGTVHVDVYARGGSDAENLADAKEVVAVLLPRV
jgi:hypothetical protein